MHSIKLLLFSLALLCWQTATSHTLQTNLQAVDDALSSKKAHFVISDLQGPSEEKWMVYHESEKIKIEYRLAECHDIPNDVHYAYYLLRVTNKTTKKMNIGLVLGEGDASATTITLKDQEHYRSLILAPGEVLESDCEGKNRDLRIFAKELKKTDAQPATIKISKIREYEL
jgi:hypothetical protein